MIRRLLNNTLVPAWNQLYVDVGNGPRDCVFIAGTERSGTTWLAECINFRHDFRLLFEPFWPHKVPQATPLQPQTYLRPGDGSPGQVEAARSILSGRIRNSWVDRYRRCFLARRRIVKDVRANLYLKWLASHFPELPVILLIRHPCAVAKSQIERKHGFGSVRDTFLSQPDLIDDHLSGIVAEIRGDHSPFEDRVFRWAIQNYVPLRQFGAKEIHVVFYEDLCTDPEHELRRLLEYLGVPYEAQAAAATERPSPMSRAGSAINTGEDLINAWRASVPDSDVSAAVDILKLFKLDSVYNASPRPVPAGLASFRGT